LSISREDGWHQAAERCMRSVTVVVLPPSLDPLDACSIDKNFETFKHSARTRAVNDSMNALSGSFRGLEKSSATPLK
jgi:hypothetical protein